MITLTLLHPLNSVPIQSWTFTDESVIRIGRAADNQVVLYSAVVSRHHVDLRRFDGGWEIINLGANGTYLDGKRISQVPLLNGMIVRLAHSGPQLQINLDSGFVKEAKPIDSQQETPVQLNKEQLKETVTNEFQVPENRDIIPPNQ